MDVRGLERPGPMIAILEFIENPDNGDQLVAVLDRDPVFLYPELAERGWAAVRIPAPLDEFRLHLVRQGGGTDT